MENINHTQESPLLIPHKKNCWFVDLPQPFCRYFQLAMTIAILMIIVYLVITFVCNNNPSNPLTILMCKSAALLGFLFNGVVWIVGAFNTLLGWLGL